MANLSTLKKGILSYHPDADVKLIEEAYHFSKAAHGDQKRLSGEPYFSHSFEVADILISLRLDATTIAAGLLHDVIEDTPHTTDILTENFGPEISRLVEGVTTIGTVHYKSTEEYQAEIWRKMFIAMAKDIRVLLIKLADRLHNMRTLEYLPAEKVKRISTETLDIYAPLAHRLGIGRIRWELEDLSFRFLQPDTYYEFVQRVKKRKEREQAVRRFCDRILESLNRSDIRAQTIGRPKHFYSIYRKMITQDKTLDEIFDLTALRVVTESVKDCYGALGIIHTLWTPVPGRFKDYIAMPKSNMYQSLHTTMMTDTGEMIEIQIRTEEMHRTSEEGIAAHWRYKEAGSVKTGGFDERLVWLRQMLEWLQDLKDPKEFMETLRIDLFAGEVFVFTPKGEVKELPEESTALDFAYAVHTEVGEHCIGARANGQMVPLRYQLQQGDMMEIITSKNQTPRRDWLQMVRTSRARNKIKNWLRAHETTLQPQKTVPLTEEEAIEETDEGVVVSRERTPVRYRGSADGGVIVEGMDGMMVRFARCCNPLPGEKIVGYATRGRGVSVHRADCANVHQMRLDAGRTLEATWDERAVPPTFPAGIKVEAVDRPNLLAEISYAISLLKINILSANAYTLKSGTARFEFTLEVRDQRHLQDVIESVSEVRGITTVRRISQIKRR